MASTYSPLLRIELIGTGDQSGIWGDTTNTNLGTLIEQSIAGSASFSVTSGNVTLTALNGSSDQSRCAILNVSGTPGVSRNIIAPASSKLYLVINGSDNNVVLKTSTSSGLTIASGTRQWAVYNGTDFVSAAQAYDADLAALAALSTTGLLARTGSGTAATRSVAVSGTGLSVANGDGVAGNPTITSNATSANTNSTVVARDASGNFSAGTITASLTGNVTGNVSGNAGTVTNGVYTTGDQTIAGTKTFSTPIVGSVTGNAGTVTNGVYTTGDQTVGGIKTFSSTIVGSVSGNAGTVTNGVYTSGTYADPAWITSLAGSKISGNIAGNAGGITGTLAVTNGGTGQTSYTNGQLLIGNSTGNTLTKSTLTAGTGISITNGTGSITISNTGGTVTSVGVSGGTTGLTTSGGPVTTSGTITLGGTLAIANGGTGATTASAARTALDVPSTTGSGASGSWNITAANVSGTVDIANGGTGATTASGARTNLGLAIGTDVPSITGTGASGSWGINITGNAASAEAFTSTIGSAPVYAARAWVNFNGGAGSASNFPGGTSTVNRVVGSTTATVTTTNPHGMITGNWVYALTGVAADDYEITVIDDTHFSFTTVATTSLNGQPITFNCRTIRARGNVANVAATATGESIINFATALPSADYAMNISMVNNGNCYLDTTSAPTNASFRVQTVDAAGTGNNPAYVFCTVVC